MAASLKLWGTIPEESELVKIINNRGASSVAQLTNNEDGIPSGPAAELVDSLLLVHPKEILCVFFQPCFFTWRTLGVINTIL